MDDSTASDNDEYEDVEESVAEDAPEIDFVTLGMFILDDIEFLPPKPPVKDILGGAGSYSALGARLFSPPPHSRSVGWIIDQGSDFPRHVTNLIDTWGTTAVFRSDDSRLTTRGWNGYGASEHRSFEYLTPKKRLTPQDLAETPELLTAKAFHVCCSPSRCRDIVAELHSLRRQRMGADYIRPLVVWEPNPDWCTPDELLNCTNTLPVVDVCSPNHAELAGFMGDPDGGVDPVTGEIVAASVERACEQLLASMPLQSFSLVIRCGERGCYVARNGGRRKRIGGEDGDETGEEKQYKKSRKKDLVHGGLQPDTDMMSLFAGLMQDDDGSVAREEIEVDAGIERWIPAYHIRESRAEGESEGVTTNDEANGEEQTEAPNGETEVSPHVVHDDSPTAASDDTSSKKVIDPTGGGNTFLGALTVAMARGHCVEESAVWGSVAASFAIEQVGTPSLGQDDEGNETWNGARVEDRLEQLRARMAPG